jgi:hypothetical protein
MLLAPAAYIFSVDIPHLRFRYDCRNILFPNLIIQKVVLILCCAGLVRLCSWLKGITQHCISLCYIILNYTSCLEQFLLSVIWSLNFDFLTGVLLAVTITVPRWYFLWWSSELCILVRTNARRAEFKEQCSRCWADQCESVQIAECYYAYYWNSVCYVS